MVGALDIGGAGGSTWFRIGNRWRQGEYLNVKNGALQLSPVGADWLSAIWWALP